VYVNFNAPSDWVCVGDRHRIEHTCGAREDGNGQVLPEKESRDQHACRGAKIAPGIESVASFVDSWRMEYSCLGNRTHLVRSSLRKQMRQEHNGRPGKDLNSEILPVERAWCNMRGQIFDLHPI
jgi:hypothetical protein